ncbi:hypothetical protein H632_c833p1 [Helicosporidium sp. ATCC 50920]|nr:hypothetical protein H632_c833p1 [Helicosporidium sp. ATCC 50920]|eukprot:KDD75166.1 hypothetical protein H632_c833p1 [Helicosporidium sp. ATCC 50920]
MVARWKRSKTAGLRSGLELVHAGAVSRVAWQARGDYLVTVCRSEAPSRGVAVHQLSKGSSRAPFRRLHGRAVQALFHPSKPVLFLATRAGVRVVDLSGVEQPRKLATGSGTITSLAVHSTGDHVLVGTEGRRMSWFDLDLSTKPYKSLRYHSEAVRAVAFHACRPLCASAADDGKLHVFHARVYADLLTNPLIVPVRVLSAHTRVDHEGALCLAFHPTQPWVVTGGADGTLALFVDDP